jgi:HEPN domain-containing protein
MANLEWAQKWLTFANHDADAACQALMFYPAPLEIVCFHCQQAAEKALKAILAYHDREIPHIYDLNRLLTLTQELEPILPNLTLHARWLTKYATVNRCPPQAGAELVESEGKLSLIYAEQILSAVTEIIPLPAPTERPLPTNKNLSESSSNWALFWERGRLARKSAKRRPKSAGK